MTTPESPEPDAPVKPARPARLIIVAVAVASLLIGAVVATGVLLITGLPGQPTHHYSVNIYLDSKVTAGEKAAIEAALPAFNPTGAVKFETREEAFQNFEKMAKDYPEILRDTKIEHMPESFRFETEGRTFDCTGFTKVRHMAGVSKIQVLQQRVAGYAATITCDAEYAKP